MWRSMLLVVCLLTPNESDILLEFRSKRLTGLIHFPLVFLSLISCHDNSVCVFVYCMCVCLQLYLHCIYNILHIAYTNTTKQQYIQYI